LVVLRVEVVDIATCPTAFSVSSSLCLTTTIDVVCFQHIDVGLTAIGTSATIRVYHYLLYALVLDAAVGPIPVFVLRRLLPGLILRFVLRRLAPGLIPCFTLRRLVPAPVVGPRTPFTFTAEPAVACRMEVLQRGRVFLATLAAAFVYRIGGAFLHAVDSNASSADLYQGLVEHLAAKVSQHVGRWRLPVYKHGI
jgi:hypothetical protein